MLTYLDGMKWNCLAQRYLYTSTSRGFKVIYKPTLHFKIIDLTSTPLKFSLSLHYRPLVLCGSCVSWDFSFGTQKMQAESCSIFAAIISLFESCLPYLGLLFYQWSPVFNYRWTKTMKTNWCSSCYYRIQFSCKTHGRNNVYVSFIIQKNTT